MNLIQLRQNEDVLVLHGAGVTAPFRGAIDHPGAGEIELALAGSPAMIEAGLARLGNLLEDARRCDGAPGGAQVFIEMRVTPEGRLWRSRLTGGSVRAVEPDARALGRLAARLALERQDFWEGPEVELPLSNPQGGAEITGGLEISNCWDAAHANFADFSQAAADALAAYSDLPAPLILDFEGIDTDTTGTLYAFQNIHANPAALQAVIEGEAGQPGTAVSGDILTDPYCSGGQFQRLSWSGEGEVTAWAGSLTAEQVARCAGRPFLPLACLSYPIYPSEKIWYFWRLTITGSAPETVLDTPGCYLPITASLCPGVPLFLPPWPPGEDETPAGLGLELRAQAAGTGTHRIDLDYLYLLALDGWRIYRPALSAWGDGLRVHDDPTRGVLRAGRWGVQAHAAEGPGLWVEPGRAMRCHFLIERAGGGFYPTTRARVRLRCRPRRRAL